MEEIRQSPLSWPDGWPRTRAPKRSAFGKWNAPHTIDRATREIIAQLERMGVRSRDVIVSTDLQYRQDGMPYSNQRQPDDKGAAVWFELRGERRVLACDRWDRIGDNLWAIGKHVEALRGQERWGVGTLDQAFRGYAQLGMGDAIPLGSGMQQTSVPWWEILEIDQSTAGVEEINAAFRSMSQEHHPDIGGDPDVQARLSQARTIGLAAVAALC